MKRLLLTLWIALCFGWVLLPDDQQVVWAQNTTCSDRPANDSSNACANTRFVKNNGGGGGGCALFTDIAAGCVPASGGGTLHFLRADGTWATPPGTIPIGGVIPWSGATVPPGFLLTYGQAISRATFNQLLTAITFNPTINCTSGSPNISVAIGTSDRVPIGAPVEAAGCFNTGATVVNKGSGVLVLSSNAIATTAVSARIFPWGNGDGSTTYNVPNLMGRVPVGRDNMSGTPAGVITQSVYGVNAVAINGIGGAQTATLNTNNLPPYTPSGSFGGSVNITDPGHSHGYISTAPCVNCGGINAGRIQASATTDAAFTGITADLSGTTWTGVAQGGSSSPFSVLQPSLTMDYIIKVFDVDATIANLVVGVTTITGGSNNTILYDNGGILGELPFATANQYNCATTGSLVVSPVVVYQTETVTAYATTINFDFCTFKNTSVTLTGNITTMNVSNVVAGKAGMITYIQDGSGGHTTVFNSVLKFTGGVTPSLTAAPGAVDILTYACRSPTFCGASLLTDVK